MEGFEIGLQVLTLGVTIYFTSQLVRNDNNREARYQRSRKVVALKNEIKWILTRTSNMQNFMDTAAKLKKRFGEQLPVLEEAYREAYGEVRLEYLNPSNVLDPDAFDSFLKQK